MDKEPAVVVEESARLRQARASFRNGQIEIKLPSRWPQTEKLKAMQSLVARLQRAQAKEEALLQSLEASSQQHYLNLTGKADLQTYVEQLNAETFRVPLRGLRVGWARHSHLAQVNLRTGVMTVSKYCLGRVPEAPFRYLILHELAHFYEASHNRRFWSLVARYCPDYKLQRKLMQAWHQQAVRQAEQKERANNE